MADFRDYMALHHSAIADEIANEKKWRKAKLTPVNEDFYKDLPYQLTEILDSIKWEYRNEPWFSEAWEKYRKHVLDAGLGGKIKMPGFVFNEYIDKYVEERSKRFPVDMYNAIHSDCDVDELYHHGVKGQRWGVRRYQNEDGTLTAEGKERYGVDSDGNMSKEGKKLYAQDKKDQKTLDRSNAKNAIIKAAKTGAVYVGARTALLGATLAIAAKDPVKGESIAKGANLIGALLTTVGGVHMVVSAVKGANEKDKILKSQQ